MGTLRFRIKKFDKRRPSWFPFRFLVISCVFDKIDRVEPNDPIVVGNEGSRNHDIAELLVSRINPKCHTDLNDALGTG